MQNTKSSKSVLAGSRARILLLTIAMIASWGLCSQAGEAFVVKKVLTLDQTGENLLKSDVWTGWQSGFARGRRLRL